jgi:hypothetical protein
MLPAGGVESEEPPLPRHLPATSWVHYTTSYKHSLVLLKMGEIIHRNMLNWLELWINHYCCIQLVVYIIIIILSCITIWRRVPYIALRYSEALHIKYFKSFVWDLFLIGNSLWLNELVAVEEVCNKKMSSSFLKSGDGLTSCTTSLLDWHWPSLLVILFHLCPDVYSPDWGSRARINRRRFHAKPVVKREAMRPGLLCAIRFHTAIFIIPPVPCNHLSSGPRTIEPSGTTLSEEFVLLHSKSNYVRLNLLAWN